MRRRAELRGGALALAVAASLLLAGDGVGSHQRGGSTGAEGWQGLLGGRPTPQLGQRQIVVLRLPSLAARVRRAGGTASESQMRGWTVAAAASQRQVLAELAFRGAPVEPEFSYVRVLNGFSASLDVRAVALLERHPQVVGVYPVRASYPAALDSGAAGTTGGRRPSIALPGFDGRGVTVALLDTGVDRTHPYIRGRLLEGIDVLDPGAGAVARPNPSVAGRPERHATEVAGLVAGNRGPVGLHGVAPGATILPIRVAGWQPDAAGGVAVYGRTDQLLAGLEAAVDPDVNGETLDGARVALVGVAEPFAAFTDGPLARACAGALALGTLVVAPVGNDGPAGPSYGSVSGPGGAPAALTVAAVDLRPEAPAVHVLLRSGLGVLLGGEQPLGGGDVPRGSLTLPVVAAEARAAVAVGRPSTTALSAYFDRRGYSRIAGAGVLLPRGVSSPEAVREARRAGARAVLVDGPLPAGSLALDEEVAVPVLGLPAEAAATVREQLAAGAGVSVSLGASMLRSNPGLAEIAPFSSQGFSLDGGVKPELAAAGVGLATSTPGRNENGTARYGAVSGSSTAAALVAGAAALLAEARPELDAAALKGALVGSAAPLSGHAGSTGAGMVDVAAAAAVEVVAEPAAAALGAALAREAEVGKVVTLRNVSRRRLDVRIVAEDVGAGGVDVQVTPERVRLWPGQTAEIGVSARVVALPRAPGGVRGTLRLEPAGAAPLRVPWAVAVPVNGKALVSGVRLSRARFKPSDTEPAVLTFVAGRVDGNAERPQLLPLDLLEVELRSGGRRRGTLVRVRNLLPGRYAFGLTGRGPTGARLRPGAYELRVVATPVGGGDPAAAPVRFHIR